MVPPHEILQWKVLVQGGRGIDREESVEARANQYWASVVRNWTRISGVSLESSTMQIIQLAKSSPFKTLHQVYDTERKEVVRGEIIKQIAPRECVRKYPEKVVQISDKWLKNITVQRCEWKPEWGAVDRHKRKSMPPRSELFGLKHIVGHVKMMVNKTPGVDVFSAGDIKLMGAFGLMKMGELFGTPLDQWPPEVWEVLHLVLEKKVGDNLNEDTRPIKLLSALLRAFTKILCKHYQVEVAPETHGYRQFAGYKGGSSAGLRRLVQCLLTGNLAHAGEAGTVLLDIAAAFDEVVQSVIVAVAKVVSKDLHEDVCRIFGCYQRMRSYVITAYGLSAW